MNSTHATLQSNDLSRAIEVEVYGDAGQPVIVLPEGDSSFASWSEGGMIDALAPLVDSGMMRLVCTDSVDLMGWYSRYAVPEYRLSNIKNFFKFVEKDLLPFVASTCGDDRPPVLAGAGMGALNACVLMLSRPQLFGGLLALSGTYDARRFVVGELPEGWEDVSPVDMVPALPQRGKAVRLLSGLPLAFVCGQDASEDGIDTQRALEQAFEDRGIDATFEYWGYDVRHDWEWWRKEAAEMLPAVLSPEGLADRRLSASLAYAEREAKHAAAQLADAQARLSAANDALKIAKHDLDVTARRAKQEEKSVTTCGEAEAELVKAARVAWAERDRVAKLLHEADSAANDAQAKADAATKSRRDAEWILGEARAAASAARANNEAAQESVVACEEEAAAATREDALARQRLEDTRALIEEERSKAKAAAEHALELAQKPATKTTAAKTPAAKKPAAKRTTASRKPAATKKPAAAKKPAATRSAATKAPATKKSVAKSVPAPAKSASAPAKKASVPAGKPAIKPAE
ncbi:alpha/beta hydrolase-fold protein [Parafannyhessea sp. LCP21S3_E6]|uniref:alpha/beta hydrolase-fold protein n=1 Tax=unclassified Parafannyhessea TaxID=2847323 RepID=UPI003F94F648